MIDFTLRPQSSSKSRMGLWGRLRVLLAGGCLVVSALGSASVVAQEAPKPPDPAPIPPVTAPAAPQPPEPGTPASIEQQQPKFFVHAEADRESREYYDGEQVGIKVKCEIDAFLYVLYTQADGQTYVVFPNSAHPDNRVKAKETVELPGKDAFRWTVGAPFGKESMKVVASRVRIPAFDKPEMRRQALTRVTKRDVTVAARQLVADVPADQWSEVALEITTHEGVNPKSPYYGKRYGVFFAVPFQLGSNYIVKALDKPATSNLGGATICDQTLMRRTLMAQGGLDDSRIYPDPESFGKTVAFRDNVRIAITEWLYSVSKPGDTVFIYFSGHGAQMEDRSAPGGKFEYLVPADTINVMTLLAMRKFKQTNPDALKDGVGEAMLNEAEGWLRENNLEFDINSPAFQALSDNAKDELVAKVNLLLLRRSTITDQEFGHWVQKLSGRRVVVILDACRSGGFGSPEAGANGAPNGTTKGISKANDLPFRLKPPPVGEFTFGRGQLARLKDLGQINTAMLAAATSDQSSLQWHRKPNPGSPRQPASDAWTEMYESLLNVPYYVNAKYVEKEMLNNKLEPIGIFTYYLVNTLLLSSGSVDVQTGGTMCASQMQQYFGSPEFRTMIAEINAEAGREGPVDLKPHQPVFFDNCQPKALLKP